jgi:hypothetical protein
MVLRLLPYVSKFQKFILPLIVKEPPEPFPSLTVDVEGFTTPFVSVSVRLPAPHVIIPGEAGSVTVAVGDVLFITIFTL